MNTDSKSQNLETETWILRLYVAGKTSKSMEAFVNLKEICKTNLKNRCEIEEIDLNSKPRISKNRSYFSNSNSSKDTTSTD